MKAKDVYVGELEQQILLIVLRLGDAAYANPIGEMLGSVAQRRVGRGALYTALERLEAKGCLRSSMGEPLPERGGRARRYFTVTAAGMRALRESRRVLLGLWDGLESKLETP
ncbi:MAG TPA: helix-turn-helix transcriptional regulator [Vicinamibacterales bacterium]|nr:helix-turn-helix transcriptional regulator [Vicinamibacterales bacterium]